MPWSIVQAGGSRGGALIGQSLPPNVNSNTFAVTSTAIAGTAVGRLYANDPSDPNVAITPTSWAITAGPGGFAIDNTGLITVSGSSLTGTGNAWMLVTATGPGGVSGPKPVFIQWGAAVGTAPVLNPDSGSLNARTLFTPAKSGTYFGCRVPCGANSGNGPSGQLAWQIDSGDPLGNFTIDQYSGEVRTAKAVSGTGTETITIRATNASGFNTYPVTINWQPMPSWLNGFPRFPGGPVVGVVPGSPLVIQSAGSISLNTGDTLANKAINGQVFVEANNVTLRNLSICCNDNFPAIKILDASFTGTGSGTNLTVSAVANGVINIGSIVLGTGVPVGTTILSQTSGVTGQTGVYVTSNPTTSSGAALTAGITGTLIENCEVFGNGYRAAANTNAYLVGTDSGFSSNSTIINKCDFHDMVSPITVNLPPYTVTNTYIHDIGAVGGGGHQEAFQFSGGFASTTGTFFLSGNYFDIIAGLQSCLELESNAGVLANPFRVDNNVFVGAGFPIVCIAHGFAYPTDCQFTNNFYGKGVNGYRNLDNQGGGGAPTAETNNVDWLTGALIRMLYIQGKTFQNGSSFSATAAVTLDAKVRLGGSVAVHVGWASTAGDVVTSVQDDQGNSYTIIGPPTRDATAGYSIQPCHLEQIFNKPQTITATINNTRQFLTIVADEISGVTALDVSTTNDQFSPGAGANAITCGPVTTNGLGSIGDLVLSFCVCGAGSGLSPGTTLAWTQNQYTGGAFMTETLLQGSPGTITSTFTATVGSFAYLTSIMAFTPGPQ